MTAAAMVGALRAGSDGRAILRDLSDGSVRELSDPELVALFEVEKLRYGPLAQQISGAFVGSTGFLFPKKQSRGIRVRKKGAPDPGRPPNAQHAFRKIVEAEFGELQRAAEVLKSLPISKVEKHYRFHRDAVTDVLGAWPPARRGRPRKHTEI